MGFSVEGGARFVSSRGVTAMFQPSVAGGEEREVVEVFVVEVSATLRRAF
jgi:hypothetical protein